MDFQSEKSFGKLRLRAFQPYHQILCMSKHVEDVEDRSNTHKGCNAMYVEDVEDIKTSHNRFPWVYLIIVEDVEDRSNTPRGCNAMYVEDVEDRSNLLWLVLISSTPFDIALISCIYVSQHPFNVHLRRLRHT